MNQNHFFDSQRGPLAWQHWQAEGRKVLCLHGWMDNLNSFLPLKNHLKQLNCDTYVVDLPGHGESFHYPKGYFYSLAEYLPPLVEFVNSTFDQPITLLSHSLGAILSVQLAALCPDKIEQLIMLDALLPPVATKGDTVARMAKSMQHMHKLARTRYYADVESMVSMGAAADIAISREQPEILCQRAILFDQDRGYYWRSDRAIRLQSPLRMSEQQAVDFLQSVKQPLNVVASEQGLLVKMNNLTTVMQHFCPHAHYFQVQGNHYFHMDANNDFLHLLTQLLTNDK